jgi:hypothetical protein
MVTPAILVSGATLAVCLVLGFVPFGPIRRRLRRRGAHSAEVAADRGGTAALDADRRKAEARAVLAPLLEEPPLLGVPFADGGRSPGWLACILVATACGAVSAAVLPPPSAPWVACAIALGALAGLRWSAARSLLSLTALGCLVAAGLLTVIEQVRHHYSAGSGWPHNFESAGVLAFVGVVALASDTTVELARRLRRKALPAKGSQA